MAEPADGLERLVRASLGAAALTADRVEQLVEALRTGENLQGVFRELGLVSRADYEELELRVAQLEHRLRLVESPRP